MMTKDAKDLDSVREDLVPWLVKGGWQQGLQARWDTGQYKRESPQKQRLNRYAVVLNGGRDPLLSAFGRSTVSRLRDEESHQPTSPYDFSRYTSANATTPSSPKVTAGQQLLDFKQELRPDAGVDAEAHWSDMRNKGDCGMTCGMIVVPAPSIPSEITGKAGNRGKPSVATSVQEPLVRGNTVAGYWALCREVSEC